MTFDGSREIEPFSEKTCQQLCEEDPLLILQGLIEFIQYLLLVLMSVGNGFDEKLEEERPSS